MAGESPTEGSSLSLPLSMEGREGLESNYSSLRCKWRRGLRLSQLSDKSVASPAAQPQAALPSHCLGLVSSFSHVDSETLHFVWTSHFLPV